MEELFKTYIIKFKDRREFNAALELNHLADDIGHADMILIYTKPFFRDRVAGYLSSLGFVSTIID